MRVSQTKKEQSNVRDNVGITCDIDCVTILNRWNCLKCSSFLCLFEQVQILLYFAWWICWSQEAGASLTEFEKGQIIDVKAIKIDSAKTQLPYDYYSLPFCSPKNGTPTYDSQSVVQMLLGERFSITPYEVRMTENIGCKLLCKENGEPLKWDSAQSNKVVNLIRRRYFVYLYVSLIFSHKNWTTNW